MARPGTFYTGTSCLGINLDGHLWNESFEKEKLFEYFFIFK